MSNSYGFDFLRTEHKLEDDEQVGMNDDDVMEEDDDDVDDEIAADSMTNKVLVDVANKSDLEKQFDILAFLQAHPGSGCLAPAIIYKATGIDLNLYTQVADMLKRNPKVRVERVPDPENPSLTVATYAYQAKYSSIRDRTSLLAQVNRMSSGVPMRDLLDSYPGIEEDLKALITAGDVIAIHNSEDRDKIIFPRGESFLVELDGIVTLPKHVLQAKEENDKLQNEYEEAKLQRKKEQQSNIGKERSIQEEEEGIDRSMPPPPRKVPIPDCYVVDTDTDPRKQVRRGEAICVAGQWFRVSSAVKAGVPLSEQPARAQAPLSVVSTQDLSKRNEIDGYIRPFSEAQLPLDGKLSERAIKNLAAAQAARDRLLKLSHVARSSGGGTGSSMGGVSAAQLTGSYAHSSNPSIIAASFATSTMNNINLRKRPNSTKLQNTSDHNGTETTEVLTKEILEKAAADINLALYSHPRRHGCTADVRELYLQTRSVVPESDHDLQRVLIENKLLDPNEQMRRPRLAKRGTNVDNDGKPKKKRYYERKNQRLTNTHLEGTALGALLAIAAEKQKQGKSVGDGGM